jgi:hypothetical protein
MTSQNGELRQTIQNSLLLKLRKFIGPDLVVAFDETEECMIALSCIGQARVEEAPPTHYGQFRGGKRAFNGC